MKKPTYIGMAHMGDDRIIVLDLRASGPGGMVGSGQMTYAPDSPHYQEVLTHLGGLEPGQEKPVPPWPNRR